MADKIYRPISIWITQILLVLFIAVFAVGFFLLLNMGMNAFGSPNSAGILPFIMAGGLSLLAVFAMSVAFWGLVERKSYGRWISVAFFSFFFVSFLLRKLNPNDKGVPFEYEKYDNATQKAFGEATEFFLYGLLLLLIITLIRSSAVKDFFNHENTPKLDEDV